MFKLIDNFIGHAAMPSLYMWPYRFVLLRGKTVFSSHSYYSIDQISIQRCDEDGDNRLRVCYSACELYNMACGAGLDCSDQTLFSKREEEEKGVPCTGYGEKKSSWI
ncbi:unnamed protein product [Triticum turgidum subsp. durum]|uniref:Uncharacterized protein n=1 Tax=Triticum turgidum subsp. durum TaxID=4567 RepID=A0A9R0SIF4_TRITD|nr:unnamed protein product [Triticum turgidum subsp. durum]